jgi:hypothetical protein
VTVFVHGVVPAARDPVLRPPDGDDTLRTRLVRYDGIAALVSDVPERASAAQALRAHGQLLDEVIAHTTVLPIRFGTAMEDERSVRDAFLVPNADDLSRLLGQLADRVQLTVRCRYDQERLLRDVVETSDEIRRLRERVRQLPDAAAYYDRIRLGELVTAEIERFRERDAELVTHTLADLAEAIRVERPNTDDGAVNAAFLVLRSRVDTFTRAVGRMAADVRQRMTVRCLGPLPPYSFADTNAWGI